MPKPIIAITLGDPAGVGPEIVLKSLKDPRVREKVRPLVIGDAQTLSLWNHRVKLKVRPVLNPMQARFTDGAVDVLHIPSRDFGGIRIGVPNKISGDVSARSVAKSVELAMTGLAQGIAHAPISKLAWKMAGINFPGHTEMIARLCGVKKVAMAIVSGPLRTVMVTRHHPLMEVGRRLKSEDITDAVTLAFQWLMQMGIKNPKVGVCALNPHAGEHGLLGSEEIKIIRPAVLKAAKKFGGNVLGPLPADSAYKDHKSGRLDCLITMYHDQSLIPLKLFDSERIINITLGLPFPRASPGHGTAFDIAGKNRANPKPMIQAILAAARLCPSEPNVIPAEAGIQDWVPAFAGTTAPFVRE